MRVLIEKLGKINKSQKLSQFVHWENIKFHDNLSSSCWDSSLKAINVSVMVALEDMSQDMLVVWIEHMPPN